jgi:hypothetical protein
MNSAPPQLAYLGLVRLSAALLFIQLAAWAQDPYAVAPDHYHLLFENAWVRVTRVTYGSHESAPVHQHPQTPTTVYIYTTDGGVMRFHHITGEGTVGVSVYRRPVKAGAIRFARGISETHSVQYLGDFPTEYVRVELHTEALDAPTRDVRLPPAIFDESKAAVQLQFENRQLRILRVRCLSGQPCPDSGHPNDPAVVVHLSGIRRGEVEWSPPACEGALELIRIELKSGPADLLRP